MHHHAVLSCKLSRIETASLIQRSGFMLCNHATEMRLCGQNSCARRLLHNTYCISRDPLHCAMDWTCRQGGVDISVDLAPHWKRCYEQRFGDLDPEHQGIPILEGAYEPSSGRGEHLYCLLVVRLPCWRKHTEVSKARLICTVRARYCCKGFGEPCEVSPCESPTFVMWCDCRSTHCNLLCYLRA